MLLEGIGEAIEQGLPLTAVVGLPFAKKWQPFAGPELVQPAPAPGATLKDTMEIGAGRTARDPAEGGILRQGLAGLQG